MSVILSPPIEDYDALVQAMRARRRDLGMTTLELEELSGLQAGYVSKLELWRHKGFGRAAGPKVLPLWLGGLGVALQLIELPRDHPFFRHPQPRSFRRDD